jgi:hypothetical protein
VNEFTRRVTESAALTAQLRADVRLHVAMLAERVHSAVSDSSSSDSAELHALLPQLLVGEVFRAFYFRLLGDNAAAAHDAATLRDAAALVADFRAQFQHIVAQQAVEQGLVVDDHESGDCAPAPPAAASSRGPGRPVKLKAPSANKNAADVHRQPIIIKQQTADDAMRVLTKQHQQPARKLQDEL